MDGDDLVQMSRAAARRVIALRIRESGDDTETFSTTLGDLIADLHHLADEHGAGEWDTAMQKAEFFYSDATA